MEVNKYIIIIIKLFLMCCCWWNFSRVTLCNCWYKVHYKILWFFVFFLNEVEIREHRAPSLHFGRIEYCLPLLLSSSLLFVLLVSGIKGCLLIKENYYPFYLFLISPFRISDRILCRLPHRLPWPRVFVSVWLTTEGTKRTHSKGM